MNHPRPDGLSSLPWLIGLFAVALLGVGIVVGRQHETPRSAWDLSDARDASLVVGADTPTEATANDASPSPGKPTRFGTTIHSPSGPMVVHLAEADPLGRSGDVACSTCHSVREPNLANHSPADFDQFHQNMSFAHGWVKCYSCHNVDDADTFRLADGTVVEHADMMTLCAQCHGPQWTDYQHGAHGGMNGHWDLSRGPRTRNHCIDCHDPHVPAFPKMQPTFKTKDRFLGGSGTSADDSQSESDHE